MTPSDACYALIKRFEGCELDAYPDPGTGAEPWTIGWGHTGPEVHAGLKISQDIADAFLMKDVEHAADAARGAAKVDLTQGQFDAFVSMVFNIGPGGPNRDGIIRLKAGAPSSFLRRLNAGDVTGAAGSMLAWNRAGGQVMNGLMRRRAAEQSLFIS